MKSIEKMSYAELLEAQARQRKLISNRYIEHSYLIYCT